MAIAALRIYLEVLGLFRHSMPSAKVLGDSNSSNLHKFGLYMSMGYLLTYGTSYLISH